MVQETLNMSTCHFLEFQKRLLYVLETIRKQQVLQFCQSQKCHIIWQALLHIFISCLIALYHFCTGDGSIVCDSTKECSVTSVISLVILIVLVCKFPFLIVLLVVSGQACCCGYVINSEWYSWHLDHALTFCCMYRYRVTLQINNTFFWFCEIYHFHVALIPSQFCQICSCPSRYGSDWNYKIKFTKT